MNRQIADKVVSGEVIRFTTKHTTSEYMSDLLVPISVNQEEQELRLMVSKRTTWPGSVPWLMATHTKGYSCSGTTSISNTFNGLGRGKSKCCRRKREPTREPRVSVSGVLIFKDALFCSIELETLCYRCKELHLFRSVTLIKKLQNEQLGFQSSEAMDNSS